MNAPGREWALLREICEAVLGATVPALDGGDDPAPRWSVLLGHAAKTRTLPVVGWALRSQPMASPPWFHEVAEAGFAVARRAGTAMLADAAVIGTGLDAAGIGYAFRKGADVCDRYPDVGCRPFGDLDLLVRREDLPGVGEVLAAAGYGPLARTREARAFLLLGANVAPTWTREGDHALHTVDVSTSIMLPALERRVGEEAAVGVEGLLERARPSKRGFGVLAPEDLLLDLVINAYLGATTLRYMRVLRFQRLTPFLDVILAATRLDDAGWERFTRRAAPFVDAVAMCAEVCCEVFPGPAARTGVTALVPGGSDGPRAADLVGTLELDEPYVWPVDLAERFTLDELPPNMPTRHYPV